MSDDTVRTIVEFDVDQSSVNAAKNAYKSVAKEIKKTAKTAASASKNIGGGLGSAARLGSAAGIDTSQLRSLGILADGLGEVASGAKDAVKSIAGSGGLTKSMVALGVVGIAAAAAMVVVAIAAHDVLKASAEQARELKAQANAWRKLNKEMAAGLTSGEAQQKIEDLNQARQDEAEILADLEEAQEKVNNGLNIFEVTVGELVFDSVKELNKQLAISDSLVKGYDASIVFLNKALGDGSFAANDAKEAAEEAAEELKVINKDLADSAERTAKIQSDATDKIADTTRKYGEAVTDAQVATDQAIAAAKSNAARASRELGITAKANAEEAIRGFNDARLEADIDFFEESQKLHRENTRALRDIIRDGTRDQKELFSKRNFLEADTLTARVKQSLEDVATAAKDEREERDIAAGEQLDELKRSLKIEQREQKIANRQQRAELRRSLSAELADIRRSGKQKLQSLKTNLERELELNAQGLAKKLELEQEFWSETIGRMRSILGIAGAGPMSQTNNNSTFNTNVAISGANMSSAQMQQMVLGVLDQTGLTQ